jgi:two-component system NtrC family sensor kinase
MKNYIKIVLLLLCLIPTLANAQDKQLDSLNNALKLANTDSAKYMALSNMGGYYSEADRMKAIYYLDQALSIAKRNNKLIDVATTIGYKGYEFYHLGKYAGALDYLEQAIEILENPKNESNSWGQDKGQTPHQFRVSILASDNIVMGNLMGKTNDVPGQMANYKKSIKIATELGDKDVLGKATMNLGYIYNDINKTDSALILEKIAESCFKRTDAYDYLGFVYYVIGDINLKKGNDAVALQFYHKAFSINIATNVLSEQQKVYGKLAGYFTEKQQRDSSLFYAKKSLAAAKLFKSVTMGDAYECLYKSYRLNGIIDSAYKYQGLALIARDSSNKSDLENLGDFQKLSAQRQLSLQQLQKEKEDTEAWIRTYALLAIIVVVMLVAFFIYRNSRQRKKANYLLHEQKEEVAAQRDTLGHALEELKTTQTQLVQREKMASLGELTAGIAHEIQNPLNFVNNFSEVSAELIDEMDVELGNGNITEAKAIGADLKQNLEKIHHHGKRADIIVKGMLQHSRTGTGEKQPTDLNVLCDEFMKLSYHGLRAKDKNFNAELVTHFDEDLPNLNIMQQDIGRVLLNLFNNAFYAVNEKSKTAGPDYKPQVSVLTSSPPLFSGGRGVVVSVRDNGNGIPDTIKDKIMQPFFTTKPTGEGTGLGLSLSYDIVTKGHGGKLKVESKEGYYTEFTIQLPNNKAV